jgi:hypothetical protein
MEVLSSDVNTLKGCLQALSALLRSMTGGDPLVDELDAILSKIPYVKAGDLILPEHHNYLVDALKKTKDIIAGMESYYAYKVQVLESKLQLMGLIIVETGSPIPPVITSAGSYTLLDARSSPVNLILFDKV